MDYSDIKALAILEQSYVHMTDHYLSLGFRNAEEIIAHVIKKNPVLGEDCYFTGGMFATVFSRRMSQKACLKSTHS